jgi:hypothetical protein
MADVSTRNAAVAVPNRALGTVSTNASAANAFHSYPTARITVVATPYFAGPARAPRHPGDFRGIKDVHADIGRFSRVHRSGCVTLFAFRHVVRKCPRNGGLVDEVPQRVGWNRHYFGRIFALIHVHTLAGGEYALCFQLFKNVFHPHAAPDHRDRGLLGVKHVHDKIRGPIGGLHVYYRSGGGDGVRRSRGGTGQLFDESDDSLGHIRAEVACGAGFLEVVVIDFWKLPLWVVAIVIELQPQLAVLAGLKRVGEVRWIAFG